LKKDVNDKEVQSSKEGPREKFCGVRVELLKFWSEPLGVIGQQRKSECGYSKHTIRTHRTINIVTVERLKKTKHFSVKH
jgi:hypothetical protein